ncbi:MAG: MerR family transcriptional regulator [Rhodocyclales bacterium]|nr:MerR family transcriptional regulator [Rhodocyclales bacterium]
MKKKPSSKDRSVLDSFSVKSAARISGLSEHMLHYLFRHGIVLSSGNDSHGHGVRRIYTYADVLLLRVIAKLLEKGISVLRLKKSLRALQARGYDKSDLVTRRFVVTDGKEVFFDSDGLLEMLSSGQLAFAFVLELQAIRNDVADRSSIVIAA